MKVLFAGGDVGGCRTLLPVCFKCAKSGADFLIYDHGHLVREIPDEWSPRKVHEGAGKAADFLLENRVGVLVFSSSVHDHQPLLLARTARHLGIPVVHVLDHWSAFAERMIGDGEDIFQPDCYAVPDDKAAAQAVDSGIRADRVFVSGLPAMGDAAQVFAEARKSGSRSLLESKGFDLEKRLLLFVSEPASLDQGRDDSHPGYRGYTEDQVLSLFLEQMQPYSNEFQIGLLPHPREDAEQLESLWNEEKGGLSGGILRLGLGRNTLPQASGVAGMASILLYEAWLVGLPVISIQPGLRQESLRMLESREGLVFIGDSADLSSGMEHWVGQCRSDEPVVPMEDALLHAKAAVKLYEVIAGYLDKNVGSGHAGRIKKD